MKKVLMGKIVAVHGIRGQVRIDSYAENPEDLLSYGDVTDKQGNIVDIQINSFKNRQLIAIVNDVSDRNLAERMIGTELYINRENMPEPEQGKYYYHDLIGIRLFNKNNELAGEIIAVHNFGAGTIIEWRKPEGGTEMTLLTPENFPEINLLGRTGVIATWGF